MMSTYLKMGWVLLGLALGGLGFLPATTITISSLADDGAGTLREGLRQSTPGDTLLFGLAGAVLLDSALETPAHPVWVIGQSPTTTWLDGQGSTRLLEIGETDTLYLENLGLTRGSADTYFPPYGGAVLSFGFLSMRACWIYGNQAVFGGAVAVGKDAGDTQFFMFDCTFSDNRATTPPPINFFINVGGAIFIEGRTQGKADVRAQNTTFSRNEAAKFGGAVFLIGDILGGTGFQARHCTFAENKAAGGGGIDNNNFGAVALQNSLVAGNISVDGKTDDLRGFIKSDGNNLIGKVGSANFVAESGDLVDQNAYLSGLAFNQGPVPTHAVACGSPAIANSRAIYTLPTDARGVARTGQGDIGAFQLSLPTDLAVDQLADQGGGSLRQAIFLACPGDTLDLSTLSGRIALQSPLVIDKSLHIIGNALTPLILDGGDSIRLVEVRSGVKVEMSWMTFTKGKPAFLGGGAILNKGDLTLHHASFYGNQAESGGAIANYGDGAVARLTIRNSTLSGNQALWLDGGAIDQRSISDSVFSFLEHCTIYLNQASNRGGGLYHSGDGFFSIRNTLIAQNQAPEGPDGYGAFLSAGHNLVLRPAQMTVGWNSSDILEQAPKLDPLDGYGGPSFTHRLQAGSPCIDQGDNGGIGETDQRGFTRVIGAQTDIGAFEYDLNTTVGEQLNAEEARLFPNPAGKQLNLVAPDWGGETLSVRVFTLQGQLIYQSSLSLSLAGEAVLPWVANLPRGIYVFHFEGNGSSWREKVQINR
ncbi:MAG: choice-of-anchor Q domain-containing protein [Bacteroidota bacterium]